MTKKVIRTSEGLKLVHQMTDRDRLAEKLVIESVSNDRSPSILSAANWAIDTAGIFFDALETDQ